MPLDPSRLVYQTFVNDELLFSRQYELFRSKKGTWEIPTEAYNSVYGLLVERLRVLGSVGENGGGGDFSVPRFVDSISEISVIVNADFGKELISLAIDVLNSIDRPFVITFDVADHTYISIISTGHVLGYSERKEYSKYGFPAVQNSRKYDRPG